MIKRFFLFVLMIIKQSISMISFSCCLLKCVFKTMYRGKRAKNFEKTEQSILVLGNGPSMKELDLEQISQNTTNLEIACVNFFALYNNSFFVIKPKYYVLLDPIFFDNKNTKESVIELFEMFNKVNWDMHIILPQKQTLNICNPNISYEYITTSIINSYSDQKLKILYYFYNKNLVCCGLQNVLCGALHYFIIRKFKRIYLSGADMSEFMTYKVDRRNHILISPSHFYDGEPYDRTMADNIPIGSFHKWLGYYVRMLEEFYHLSKFAESQGVKVYNLSVDSYIDCFEKTDWTLLFNT